MATAEQTGTKALVSTQWVAEHIDDPNVRLVEVDVDTTSYEQGHIRNAAGWNWQTQLEDRVQRDIPTKADWERLLGQAGVSNNTKLVFYGDNNNWFAAFAYWIAKIYGHQDAALMDGGRKKWELEHRPLVTDLPPLPTPPPTPTTPPTEATTLRTTTYAAHEADPSLRAFLGD